MYRRITSPKEKRLPRLPTASRKVQKKRKKKAKSVIKKKSMKGKPKKVKILPSKMKDRKLSEVFQGEEFICLRQPAKIIEALEEGSIKADDITPDERRLCVYELIFLRGAFYHEVAVLFGVSATTINHDVKKIRERVAGEVSETDTFREVGLFLIRQDVLYRRALTAQSQAAASKEFGLALQYLQIAEMINMHRLGALEKLGFVGPRGPMPSPPPGMEGSFFEGRGKDGSIFRGADLRNIPTEVLSSIRRMVETGREGGAS